MGHASSYMTTSMTQAWTYPPSFLEAPHVPSQSLPAIVCLAPVTRMPISNSTLCQSKRPSSFSCTTVIIPRQSPIRPEQTLPLSPKRWDACPLPYSRLVATWSRRNARLRHTSRGFRAVARSYLGNQSVSSWTCRPFRHTQRSRPHSSGSTCGFRNYFSCCLTSTGETSHWSSSV